ncbi:MAG: hypothetical protein HQL96_06205 [Magnetococcales bacterium]|nr:hypothetical protein [Magnetococcales bacterium]
MRHPSFPTITIPNTSDVTTLWASVGRAAYLLCDLLKKQAGDFVGFFNDFKRLKKGMQVALIVVVIVFLSSSIKA